MNISEDILKKAEHYCIYQERSQNEVRNKLYEWECKTYEVEQILTLLIENNFINEMRYAEAIVSGKFNIKKWGKTKIKQTLKLQKISEYCIKKALSKIDENEYYNTLESLALKKYCLLQNKIDNKYVIYKTLYNYLYSKGFENDLIKEVLKQILEKN